MHVVSKSPEAHKTHEKVVLGLGLGGPVFQKVNNTFDGSRAKVSE